MARIDAWRKQLLASMDKQDELDRHVSILIRKCGYDPKMDRRALKHAIKDDQRRRTENLSAINGA